MFQPAFVEELLKRVENQCLTKTRAIPANPLIELGPKTENNPGGNILIGRRLKHSVAFQHSAAGHRECCLTGDT